MLLSSDALQRYQTAADVPNYYVRKQRSLSASAASVTDGDTLRVRHTPLPLSSTAFKGKLSEETIQVRLLAVDAPEIGKFGSASQPYAEEAREFVKGAILNKNVRLRVVARDQYGRLVGEVRYGLLGRKELSTELVRRGLAVVYRGKDASYGGRDRAGWERLEATARKTRQGMWKDGGDGVSPSEYKRQQKARRG